MKTLSLFLFNSVEEEWQYTSSTQGSYLLSDSYLFMNSFIAESILITPIPVSEQFKKYVEGLAGVAITTYSPIHASYSLCRNIIADKKLFSQLVYEAKKRNNILEIRAYVSTPELYELKNALENKGIKIVLPENTSQENLYTVDFFGSKAGFRSVFSHCMPQGYICYTKENAVEKADYLYQLKKAVVIKTNKGNCGEGVQIIKDNQKPHFQSLLSSPRFINKFPLVIEEYIDTSKEDRSPFPSIEGFITQKGMVKLPYYCNMIVTKEGEFYGIEMHKKVVTEKVRNRMNTITKAIGKTYAQAGYRGRFDVDFIYDGKKLYANESNTRTNGGTDTFFITRKLIGRSFFTSRSVLSNYIELKKQLSFDALYKMVNSLLYNKKTKTGLILGSENALKHKGFSFILIGNNKAHTQLLEKKMMDRLKSILTIKKNK